MLTGRFECAAETLVHSSFVPVPSADFVASVPVEGEPTDVWVYKRPFLDFFMTEVAAHFEVVIFTASLATYADVVLDILDQGSMQHRGDAAGVTGGSMCSCCMRMLQGCLNVAVSIWISIDFVSFLFGPAARLFKRCDAYANALIRSIFGVGNPWLYAVAC